MMTKEHHHLASARTSTILPVLIILLMSAAIISIGASTYTDRSGVIYQEGGVIFTPKEVLDVPKETEAWRRGVLPSGRDVYQIASIGDQSPRLLQAVIDPLDAHPGDVQTLELLVEDTSQIREVVAYMETDNGYVTIPLHKTDRTKLSSVDQQKADRAQRSIDEAIAQGTLQMPQPSRFADAAAETRSGFVSVANAQEIHKAVYEGRWTVYGTHSAVYNARFVATNMNDESNEVTLVWRDPCTPPLRGNWTLDSNCGFTTVEGIAPDASGNGDLILNTAGRTLTLTNSTFVVYPNKKVTLTAGNIALNQNGKIMQTKLWALDADSDRWGVSRLAQLNSPGSTYKEQSLIDTNSTTVGPTSGSGGASMSSGGTVVWTNPQNAETANNIYATASVAKNAITRYLKVGTYGFTLPTDAIIVGIKVEIERKSSVLNTLQDNPTYGVRLTKDGTNFVGDVKSSATFWPTSDAYATYGGTTDLWGTTWTASEVNAGTFAAAIALHSTSVTATASVDHFRITVYARYPVVTNMGDCNDASSGFTNNCSATPTCSPSSQSVGINETAFLSAEQGNGTYSWTATGGDPSSGSGSSFNVSYTSSGAKTVTVTSNSQNANCTVNVAVTPPLTCSPSSQGVSVNELAELSATGGTGSYTWGATGGSPNSGSGSSFDTSYASTGNKSVTLNDGSTQTSCTVSVSASNCYPDVDGDGHYSSSAGSCSGSYSDTAGDDCDDNDANVFTGQTAWFSSPRSNGSYDYSCNGIESKERSGTTKFQCDPVINSTVQSCVDDSGWLTTEASCGATATHYTCQWVGGCQTANAGLVQQRCR